MTAESQSHTFEAPAVIGYFYDHHAVSGIDPETLIRWICIAIIWLLAALWHQHQNKAFHEYIKNKKARTKLNDRLSHLAYNRAFEVMGVFFILILTLIFYDTRIYKAESDLQLAENNAEELQFALDETEAALEESNAALDQAYDRITTGLDETKEEALNSLKERYEGLFINYYILKGCNVLTRDDFVLLNTALIQELTDFNARAGIRKRILEAAKDSYEELHATTQCDPNMIQTKEAEVRDYLQKVMATIRDEY